MSLSNVFLIMFLNFLAMSFDEVANIVSISSMATDDVKLFEVTSYSLIKNLSAEATKYISKC